MNEDIKEDIPEVAQEAADASENAPEVAGEPEEAPKKKSAPKAAETPDSVRAESGDSYLSIARRYLPEGRALGVWSAELVRINRNRPVREGVKIYLKETK